MATARKIKKTGTPTPRAAGAAAAKTAAKKTRSAGKPAALRRAANGTNGKRGTTTPARPVLDQKEQLEKERAQVASELVILRAELQQAPEMTGDEVDLNVYERERTLGLVAAYERRLEEINAALQAAQKGKYGICERCGKTIDPERLKIFPEARLCVSCKNEVEREQRRARL